MVKTAKSILVTGGAGFIGGHLVELLLKEKYQVTVVDIQKPNPNYFFASKLDQKVDYQRIDITDRKKLDQLFVSLNPQYVIHLAATSTVGEACDNPRLAFETNIMGTVNILEACRRIRDFKGVIVASSDKAYGKTETTYTEDSPLKGDHPYDVSKSCEDLIALTYFKTYGLLVVVTRFGNVYGEGDLHFERIIPGICQSAITGKTLEVRSDGTYIRDYVYVKDVANGYFFLLGKLAQVKGQAFNVSSTENCSVLDLISRSQAILKTKISYTIKNTAKNEIPFQHLNDVKIRRLGWKSRFNLPSTLPTIYKWYKKLVDSS